MRSIVSKNNKRYQGSTKKIVNTNTTTSSIQRRVTTNKMTKYKKPIGNKDNVQSRFVKGISNQATDYQAIVNPDYEHKSILNQAIDKSLQGEFGAAGKLIQDNPARFAGNVVMEAGTFLVPVGAALKVAKGASIAIKQSQRLPKIQEKIISKVTRKPERMSLFQVVGVSKKGKPLTSEWYNKHRTSNVFFWKGSKNMRNVVVKEIKVPPIKAEAYTANYLKSLGSKAPPVSRFMTKKTMEQTNIVGDFVLPLKSKFLNKAHWQRNISNIHKRPVSEIFKRDRSTNFVFIDRRSQRTAKVIARFSGEKDNQSIANLLTRQGHTKKKMKTWLSQETIYTKEPKTYTERNVMASPATKNIQDLFEGVRKSKVKFDPIIELMEQGNKYQKFIPFATIGPILSVTQKTSSLRKRNK